MTDTATLSPVDEALAKRLKRAAQLQAKWLEERNTLILEAHDSGAGVREIARMVNLSHPGVLAIIARANRQIDSV